jgi:hypothetical protein
MAAVTRDQWRLRLVSAAWMFGATVLCGVLCFVGLFKGTDVLYSRGHVPAIMIFGGFIFGLAAPVCFIWMIKILVKGSAAEHEAPTTSLEQPWWRNQT